MGKGRACVFACAVLLAALVALVPSSTARASVTDPLVTPSSWTTPGTGGSSTLYKLMSGLDSPAAPGAFVDRNGIEAVKSVDSTWQYFGGLQDAAEVVPRVWKVPAFGTLTLLATAFQVGWEIGGSDVNKRLWTQLLGTQLGTNQAGVSVSGCNSSVSYTASWIRSGTGMAGLGYPSNGPQGDGWILHVNSTSSDANCARSDVVRIWDGVTAGSSAIERGMRAYVVSHVPAGGWQSFGNNFQEVRYFAAPQLGSYVTVDPLQPYTGQAHTVSTSFRQPGGVCDTTDCGALGSGPTEPAPCVYQTAAPGSSCGSLQPTDGGGMLKPRSWTPPAVWPPAADDPNGNWMRCRIDPVHYACPVVNGAGTGYSNPGGAAGQWEMPNCAGLTVVVCEGEIGAAADGANATPPIITQITLGIEGAVLTLPADTIALQDPAPATIFAPDEGGATITVSINPNPMPVLVPQPAPWVKSDEYCAELEAAGFTCVIQTLNDPDPAHGPGEVTRVEPRPGTRQIPPGPGTGVKVYVNPLQTPAGDPLPYPKDDPNDPQAQPVNPNDPAPTPEPTRPGDPTTPGSGGSGTCNCPPPNFTPLTSLQVGSKFPFGVFAYVTATYAIFNVQPVAPGFDIQSHAHGSVAGHGSTGDFPGEYKGDLTFLDGYMSTVRLLMSFALWIGALWFVGTRMLGFHMSGDLSEAADDGSVL
jgi:hypothetical protein